MRELTIHRLYFTQADCYKTSKSGTPHGVQVHSTGANNPYLHRYVGPDDGLLGPNKYDNTHNRPGGNVCANAYIGLLADGKTVAVYQALPWEQHCWLSASGTGGTPSANAQGFIGFEVCEDSRQNRAYFEAAVWTTSVNLCAYLCWKYSLLITSVRDHQELHKMGMASDHGDITWWLKPFGQNMDKYRAEVAKAILEGVRVKYIEGDKTWYDGPEADPEPEPEVRPVDKQMIVTGDGYLNLRSAPSKSAGSIGRLYPGDIVTVMAEYPEGWAFVLASGQQGYCMEQYLADLPAPDPQPAPEPAPEPEPEPVPDPELTETLAQICAYSDKIRELAEAAMIKLNGAVG